jgi:hypothetical protein
MDYARFQQIIHRFVREAFKQEVPKEETTPSLQDEIVKKQNRHPTKLIAGCSLYIVNGFVGAFVREWM